MRASSNDHTETIKILVEQEGIDINAKDISLFSSIFISIILKISNILNGR